MKLKNDQGVLELYSLSLSRNKIWVDGRYDHINRWQRKPLLDLIKEDIIRDNAVIIEQDYYLLQDLFRRLFGGEYL